ncbi:hypothetical protein ACYX8G_16175 [Microbacterium saperdae]
MAPNPLLPSIPDMIMIGAIVAGVIVLAGIGLAIWLRKRRR